MTAVTPGSAELLADRIEKCKGLQLYEEANTNQGYTTDTLLEEQRAEIVAALRLAAKPDEDGTDERLSIIVGVKNVLEFAIGLAWDAERLIPDSEPKRLRNILNNIRLGYLKPAVERLSAVSPSTTGEPKP